MRSKVSVTGDWSMTKSFLTRSSKYDGRKEMEQGGKQAVAALKSATPVRSGATAAGWDYKVSKEGGMMVLSVVNNAYPGLPVNVALLINYGHGTGTGGYVPAVPFIKPAIDGILSNVGDNILKGVK